MLGKDDSKQSKHPYEHWGFLSPFYALGLRIRHFLFDHKIFSSRKHPLKTIGVGNLDLGGTGKTPLVEYLLRYLGEGDDLAVLSRGYGRNSKSLQEIRVDSSFAESGDELLQIKQKFPNVHVVASSDRNKGMEYLQRRSPKIKCVVLDDNFQHRQLQVDHQILLTSYQEPYFTNHLFPKGSLRDLAERAKEADFLLVTKCPSRITKGERASFYKHTGRTVGEIAFSSLEYHCAYALLDRKKTLKIDKTTSVLLLTGIAKPKPLLDKVRQDYQLLEHLCFDDHYVFAKTDLAEAFRVFLKQNPKGIILTTEKDAIRLLELKAWIAKEKLPIYVIGISCCFIEGEEAFKHKISALNAQ